jgi:hypothetical protein
VERAQLVEGILGSEQARGEEAVRLHRGDMACDSGTIKEGGEVEDHPEVPTLVDVVMDLGHPHSGISPPVTTMGHRRRLLGAGPGFGPNEPGSRLSVFYFKNFDFLCWST